MPRVQPTGRERFFEQDEIIVSKTDLAGKVTYANRVFLRIAGYTEAEILGAPHSVIRHPDMPRCVFHLLWQTIAGGEEIFAYVVNLAKNGDHYWVLAHVTPSFDEKKQIVGYHSSRRCPSRAAIAVVEPLYAELRKKEESCRNKSEAIAASTELLSAELKKAGQSYAELVFALSREISSAS